MFLRSLFAAAAAMLSTTLATAQISDVFNIDFNAGSLPPTSYGGAPNNPGVWNSVPANATNQALASVFGGALNNSAITVTGAFLGANNPALIPAPHQQLYRDFLDTPSGTTVIISNLNVGRYAMFLYVWSPNRGAFPIVVTPDPTGFPLAWNNSGNFPPVQCPAGWPGAFVQTQSMSSGEFEIFTANDTLTITLPDDSILNGLQMIPIVSQLVGCAQPETNSTGAHPSMFAFTASNGDRIISVGSLPGALPTGTGILTWASTTLGSNVMQPCPFIGTRCVGPVVARINDPVTGGVGTPSSSGIYNIRISAAMLVAQGILPTPVWSVPVFFQMNYRDVPNAGGACATSPSVVRWTPSIEVN